MGKLRITVIEVDDDDGRSKSALLDALQELLLERAEVDEVEVDGSPEPEPADESSPAETSRGPDDAESELAPTRGRTFVAPPQPPEPPSPPELKEGTIVAKIIEAYRSDNHYSQARLAKEIYGDAYPRSILKLKGHLEKLKGMGRLKRIGATSYKPVE